MRFPIVVLSLLAIAPGCDKLPFGGDEPKAEAPDPAKTSEDEAARAAELEAAKEAAKKEALAEHGKNQEASIEARIAEEKKKAAEEALEKAALDAAAKAAAEADAKRKVVLSDLVISGASMFGPSSAMVEIKMNAELKEALGSSTYVHVKAMCEHDGRIFTDIGYLSANYTKPLEQYAVGEKAEVSGNLFSQGFREAMKPCQLSFRLAGMGTGGLSEDLGSGCWDGTTATLAACEKPIVAVAASGAPKPIEVLDIRPQATSYGSGLNLDFQLLFHIKYNQNERITMKASCQESGKALVNITQSYMPSGPFEVEAGEAIARSGSFFWGDAYAFGGPPKLCDLTVSRWVSKSGSYGDYEEELLKSSCLRDTTASDGRCDGGSIAVGTGTALTATNTVLDGVALKLTEPYGSTGTFQLDVQADATVSAVLTADQGINADVSCKVGRETRVETAYLYGTDLYYLMPGETARLNSSTFTSHPMAKPTSCEVKFSGGARYGSPGAGIDLGTFCYKKDKLKSGKC